MITMVLDWIDFLYAVEGFACGSHLRQHIWQEIVEKYISQMSNKERDTIWFYLRRDIWPLFFEGKYSKSCGAEDFLHCMAAMQRNNYADVTFRENGSPKGNLHTARCYIVQNTWYATEHFTSFVPFEWIASIKKIETEPLYIEQGKESWWKTSLDLYNLPISEVRKLTTKII